MPNAFLSSYLRSIGLDLRDRDNIFYQLIPSQEQEILMTNTYQDVRYTEGTFIQHFFGHFSNACLMANVSYIVLTRATIAASGASDIQTSNPSGLARSHWSPLTLACGYILCAAICPSSQCAYRKASSMQRTILSKPCGPPRLSLRAPSYVDGRARMLWPHML